MKTYEIVDGREVEIDPGSGGSFEIREGKRIRVSEHKGVHPDGERPRNADGTPVDKPIEKSEPALPKAARAPWEPPQEPAAPKTKARSTDAGQTKGA